MKIAAEREVQSVVWAGDVFHIKTPSKTSHGLVQKVADIVTSYHCPLLIVPGNHDMTHDRLDSLDRQPLGVLSKAGAVLLDGQAPLGMNYLVFGVPWLQDWNDLGTYMKEWKKSDCSLMVTHAPIVPPGETRPYFTIDAAAWAESMNRGGNSGQSAVYYGHMHDPDGDYSVENSYGELFVFCNQGALSRGSLHESTLARKPAVTLFDSSATVPFERIEIDHLPAKEVFNLDIVHAADESQAKLDEFLAGIDRTELKGLTTEGVLDEIEQMDISSPLKSLVKELVEEAASK